MFVVPRPRMLVERVQFAHLLLNIPEVTPEKIFGTNCITSHDLNSAVGLTEPNCNSDFNQV